MMTNNTGATASSPAMEEYNCSDCAIKIFAASNKCPTCGDTMWKVSQLRNMGKFFLMFFGILAVPLMVLGFVGGVVGFVFSFKQGGTVFWLGHLFVFGTMSMVAIRGFTFFRKMAREGVFDKKLQAKGARVIPPV